MKKFIFFCLCVFAATLSANAQDLIVKKDGSVIQAKVISIGEKEIEYKRSDYMEGPTISIEKDVVLSITYANGMKEVFENAKAREISEKGITLRMAYDDYKDFYNTRDYMRSPYDPYSPAGSGIASFFIPGLGQMINGQVGKGALMLGGDILLGVGAIVAAVTMQTKGPDGKVSTSPAGIAVSLSCCTGMLALDIWSICDAVKVAKIKNLYARDCQQLMSSNLDIKMFPALAFVPNSQSVKPVPGLTLAIKF